MNTIVPSMAAAFHSQFTFTSLSEEQRADVRSLFVAFEKMQVAASEFKRIHDTSWPEQESSSPELGSLFQAVNFIVDYNPDTQAVFDKQFNDSVDLLEFTHRTTECLKAGGIFFIGHLVKKTENQLLTLENLGRRSLNEIKEVLATRELRLGMNVVGWKPPAG